ncbi:hypothetical protein V6N13_036417 [Hibiscus sabdariffa]
MKAKIILIKAEKKKIGKYPIREFGESGEREAVIGIDRELGVDEEKDGLLYSIQSVHSSYSRHAPPTEAGEQGLKSTRDDYLWAVVAAAWVASRVSPTMTTVTSAGEKSTTSTAVGGL